MKESADPAANLEEPAPPSKGWLVDQIERTADQQKRLSVIQERNQLFGARHDRIQKRFSTALIAAFTVTAMFGLVMGAIAMWNAVVG